jgi:putative PIN family toxin of toxin-antitoxin system
MLKAVVDTNVFVSGLLKSPKSRRVIQAIRDGQFSLIISPEIFQEIIEVITRPKFHNVITGEIIQELRELIRTQAILVRPRQKLAIIREDRDDNRFLEAASTGKAN